MRVLIVGCGSIGRRHLRNLYQLCDVEIIAYRRTLHESEELEREFNLRAFPDLAEALREKPQFALITNPTSLHVPIATEVARAGCHLFIEKPLSHSVDGIDELVRLVKERGLVSFVAFNFRFHPGLQLINSLIDEGRIGRVLSIDAQVGQYLPDWHPREDYRFAYSAQSKLGGGVILDLIHELDYVRWLVGEVSQLSCFASHVSDLEIETDDLAEILLCFDTGAIGRVHMDYLQRAASRTCRIIGEKGTLLWDYFANEVRLFDGGEADWQVFDDREFERNNMYVEEMRHFLACLEGRETPAVDIEEGARVLRLALAAHESSQTGKTCNVGGEKCFLGDR